MNQPTQSQETGKLCGEILFLIPAYAMGTTDPDETAFVEANLAACPEAAAALGEYRRLVDDMRENVPQVEPSPELEDRLMARLAGWTNPQVEVVPPPNVLAKGALPSRRPARSLLIALAATAAAVLLLIATNLYWIARVNSLTQENIELVALFQQQGSTMQLANLDRLQWRRLQSADNPNVLAVMVWDNADGFLYTLDMPALPPDSVYQLWLARDNERVSAGTFRVDQRGRGTLHFLTPDAIQNYERMGITTEPEGGSEAPTSDAVVRGEL